MNREILSKANELNKELTQLDIIIDELNKDDNYSRGDIGGFASRAIHDYHCIPWNNIPKDEINDLRAIHKHLLRLAYNKRSKLNLALSKL